MARSNQQVQKTPEPKSALPAFMQKDVGKGTEDWTSSDYEMPRLKLLQGISPELQQWDGLTSGDFFHTILEESLGKELTITVLYVSKRYVLWRPRPPIDSGGILARADDGIHWSPASQEFEVKIDKRGTKAKWQTKNTVEESGLAAWGTYDPEDSNSPPAATECQVFVVWIHEHPAASPVALMLQRGSIKVGRRFRGKLKFTSAPIYGAKYKMTPFIDGPSEQQFNNYRFTADGFVEDEELYLQLQDMHNSFAKAGINIRDVEGAQDEGAGAEAVDGKKAAAEEKRF